MRKISKFEVALSESFFTYDFAQDNWIKQESSWHYADEMSSQNIALCFRAPGYVCDLDTQDNVLMMWCAKHNAYEQCQDDGTTSRGCQAGRFQFFMDKVSPEQAYVVGKKIPILWCVKQLENEEALEVTVHTATVKLPKALKKSNYGTIYEPAIKLGSKFAYTFYPATKTCKTYPEAALSRQWRIDFEIPLEVFDEVQLRLQKIMVRLTGRNILLPTQIEKAKWEDLWFVIDYPEDVHIAYLRDFFGRAYDRLFFRERNNYQLLCQLLQIDPPKSVRRYYLQNPYAILLYTWMKRVGFHDINAIRIFMKPMYYQYMASVRLDWRTGKMKGCSMPCAFSGSHFVFYVRWMLLRGKQEMPLVRQLDRLMREGWTRIYDDMLRMFHLYYLVLPETTKELVKRRGICLDTHNALACDTAAVKIVAKKIKYNEEVYALNGVIGEVSFRVIDQMAELADIGSAMSNCVASYMEAVVRWRTIIAVGMIGKEYKICIELRPKTKDEKNQPIAFACCQALGRFNRKLEGVERAAYRTWIKEKGIEDLT